MENANKPTPRIPLNKLEECLQFGINENRLEGMEPTPAETEKIREYLKGEITMEEMIKWGVENGGKQ